MIIYIGNNNEIICDNIMIIFDNVMIIFDNIMIIFYNKILPVAIIGFFCWPHIEVLKYEHYIINTNYLFNNKNSNEKIGIVSFQPIGLYLQIFLSQLSFLFH